jgi:metal-responsive CopG/Arc/MetJ family transcriptional regulator
MRYDACMTSRRRYKTVPVKRTTVTIPIDLLGYLDGLAESARISRSGMIVQMIEWYKQGHKDA